MTNKAIEELATTAVKKSIITTDYLDQYISENDKEPTWDGNVYIYGDKKKKKEDLTGRVSVQIKGKQKNDMPTKYINFDISTVDMNNFLNDGGAVYFVVYISSDGLKETIYYVALSPVKLKLYLKDTEGKKTKSIKLTPFPIDKNQIATIFLNFLIDCRKQVSFAKKDVLSLEDLRKQDILNSLTISVSGYGYNQNDLQKAFIENEVYLYANIKGINTPIPLDLEPCDLQVKQIENCTVSVKGIKYYSSVSRVHYKDKTVIKIGESLTITLKNNNGESLDINYNSAPLLSDRIKDTEFFIEIINAKHFYIDNVKLDINITNAQLRKFNIKEHTELIEYCKKIQKTLKILNVQQNINIPNITEQELRELDNLVTVFVEKKTVRNIRKDIPLINKIKILDMILILVFEETSKDSGEYNILNFSQINLDVKYSNPNDNNEYLTSQYSLLKKDDYIQISNLDYDTILPSYQVLLESNPYIYEMANRDLLCMISAYDVSKNSMLLKVIKSIAEWILYKDKEIIQYEVKLLNYLQIIRRERELNDEEVKDLCLIIENVTSDEEFKVAAYLLLDNQKAAQMHFYKMDNKKQDNFKSYPIFIFWKE